MNTPSQAPQRTESPSEWNNPPACAPLNVLIPHPLEQSTRPQVLQRTDSSIHWRNRDANVRNVLKMFSKRFIEWPTMAKTGRLPPFSESARDGT